MTNTTTTEMAFFPRRFFTPTMFVIAVLFVLSCLWATINNLTAQITTTITTRKVDANNARHWQDRHWQMQMPTFDNITTTSSETTTATAITTTTCHKKRYCCVRTISNLVNPYFPYSRNTPTIDDRISSIDMKLIADVHFGTLKQPEQYTSQLVKLTRRNLPCLLDGAVIFVDSVDVKKFMTVMLPRMKTQFVLVTGDSDRSVPGNRLDPSRVNRLLIDERLLHWYAMNCDRNPNPQRFTCLPIGISQWDNEQYQRPTIQTYYEQGHGLQGLNSSSISHYTASSNHDHEYDEKKNTKEEKNITLFAAFSLHSNTKEREPVWDMACNPDGVLYNRSICAVGINVSNCYELMSRSKFVLSPHGQGLDCYRTYESLYLGAFPIVKTSSLDEMYRHLPVLIVQNWTDLAKDGFLEQKYQDLMDRLEMFQWERLYKGFWYAKFRSHHPEYRQYYQLPRPSTTWF